MRLSDDYLLSYRLLDLQVPGTYLGGRADGAEVDLPVVVVNPSLEAVFLRRDQDGNWKVDTVSRYVRRGLSVGSLAIQLRAVPGGTAHLGVPTDGSSPSLTVRLTDNDCWPVRVDPEIAANIRRQRGVVLVVTTAIDPLIVEPSRLGEEFHALMKAGNCAAGWIPLAGAQQPFHGEPVARLSLDQF